MVKISTKHAAQWRKLAWAPLLSVQPRFLAIRSHMARCAHSPGVGYRGYRFWATGWGYGGHGSCQATCCQVKVMWQNDGSHLGNAWLRIMYTTLVMIVTEAATVGKKFAKSLPKSLRPECMHHVELKHRLVQNCSKNLSRSWLMFAMWQCSCQATLAIDRHQLDARYSFMHCNFAPVHDKT